MHKPTMRAFRILLTASGLFLGAIIAVYLLVGVAESLSRTAYREVGDLRIADYPDDASTLRLTFELGSSVKTSTTTTVTYPICAGFDWIEVSTAKVSYEVIYNECGGGKLVLSCAEIDLAQPIVVDIHYPLNDVLVSDKPIGCAVEGGIGLADVSLEDPRLAEIVATASLRNEADIVDWMRKNIKSVAAEDLQRLDGDATAATIGDDADVVADVVATAGVATAAGVPETPDTSFTDYDPYHLQDVSETLDRGKGDCKARIALFCGFLRELDPTVEFEMILCYPQGYEARLGDPKSPWTHVLVRVKKGDQYLIFDPILDAQYTANGKSFLGIPITGAVSGVGEPILTAAPMVPAGPYVMEITVLDPEVELQAVKVAVLRSSTDK